MSPHEYAALLEVFDTRGDVKWSDTDYGHMGYFTADGEDYKIKHISTGGDDGESGAWSFECERVKPVAPARGFEAEREQGRAGTMVVGVMANAIGDMLKTGSKPRSITFFGKDQNRLQMLRRVIARLAPAHGYQYAGEVKCGNTRALELHRMAR